MKLTQREMIRIAILLEGFEVFDTKIITDVITSEVLKQSEEFVFFVFADWLKHNTLQYENDTEKRKKLGNYFMSFRDFTKDVISSYKKKFDELFKITDEKKFMTLIHSKQRYYLDFKHQYKNIIIPFVALKSHLSNIHNSQAEKFEPIDDNGIFNHMKLKGTTPEVNIKELFNDLKLLASSLHKASVMKSETSFKKFSIIEAITTAMISLLCYYTSDTLNHIEKSNVDKNTLPSKYQHLFIFKECNKKLFKDESFMKLYLDFLTFYGESLNKQNLDILDYDELMSWKDDIHYSKQTVEQGKKFPFDKNIKIATLSNVNGKYISIIKLGDEIVELQHKMEKLLQIDDRDNYNKILNSYTDKLPIFIQAVLHREELSYENLTSDRKNVMAFQDFNNRLKTEYEKIMTPEQKQALITFQTMDRTGIDMEEWLLQNVGKYYIALDLGYSYYKKGLEYIDDVIHKIDKRREKRKSGFDVKKELKLIVNDVIDDFDFEIEEGISVDDILNQIDDDIIFSTTGIKPK